MGEAGDANAVEAFIRRWQGREGGQERANYVSFLNKLIALLGLPPPDPADATHEHNDYVFERAVKKQRDELELAGADRPLQEEQLRSRSQAKSSEGPQESPGPERPVHCRHSRRLPRPPRRGSRMGRADAQCQVAGGRLCARSAHVIRLAAV